MPFDKIRGKSFLDIPYINHKKIPEDKKLHIQKDISLVSFNLIVLMT